MSPFDTRGAFSREELSERGFNDKEEEWFEEGHEFFYEEEARLSEMTHDAVARWQREHPTKKPPRELLLALGMTAVFAGTTELARRVSEEEGLVVSSVQGEKPPVPLKSQDELARLILNAPDGSPTSVSVLRFGRENDTGDDFFVETPVSLAGAVEGNPIVFHEPIGSLSFVRSTTLEKVGRNLGTQYVDNLQVFGCVSISYRDLNGNKINVIYNQDTATGAIRETIAVSTTWNFADRPELQPLDLDLRPIGYGVIEGAFYVKPLVHIGDQSGYAYFSTDGSSAMAKELMVERGEAIRTGIQEALSLFGLPEDNITGVTIMDRGFSNAYADARTQSVIYFTDEILEGPGQMGLLEQMIKGGELTEEAVASVAAHEVFHQIDHLYDISRDERVRSLFRRLSKADLFRVNEKRDGKLYGGHAQDDQMELFASFMNTIRGDNWERRRAWMTFEDVLVYEEIVGVILERLEDIPELGDAPVRDVLRARQEELNQRIRARE